MRDESIREPKPSIPLPIKLREQIALCCDHPESVMFLDLETTGLSHYYDEITLFGWSLSGKAKTIVRGQNRNEFLNDIESAKALVTFNGKRFDVRFLKKELPDIVLPPVHLDLMYLCRRVGLTGGQKAIEDEIELRLRDRVEGIDGQAAVLLWHRYQRGDLAALNRLIAYNRADIAALGSILNAVLGRLDFWQDMLTERTVDFSKWSAPKGWDMIPQQSKVLPESFGNPKKYTSFFDGTKAETATIVGIDLTGSEDRASGWCSLNGRQAVTALLRTSDEMISRTLEVSPHLVSIDSPLCLPTGRVAVTDDDPGRDQYGIMRECERELKRRGVNVYPCLIKSMQKLTARGMELASQFRKRGIPVIESYPGAAQDIIRIPRKGAGVEWLHLGIKEFGLELTPSTGRLSHDELDAVTSALVGTFHLAGLTEELGTLQEPPLVIPDLGGRRMPTVVGISGPVAAGKTTVSRFLEGMGYAYTRFSLVIDEMLAQQGKIKNRQARRTLGIELHLADRQTELAARTFLRAGNSPKVVVDGLRFPEDHAYLFERAGFGFLHMFIDADASLRRMRYEHRFKENREWQPEFENVETAPVERAVEVEMRGLAHQVLYNDGTLRDLECMVRKVGG